MGRSARRRGVTRSAALWCASAALVAGCVEPRTSVLLRVESELSWGEGARVQSVVVEVRRDGATGPLRSQRVTALGVGAGRSSLPLLIEARESTGDVSAPLWVEALGCATPNGCDRDGAVVAQRAVVRFVERETLRVTLLLASACAGVRCDTSERCETTSGACVPVEGEGRVDAGRDAAVDATDVRDATTMDAGERDVEQDVTTLDAGIDGRSGDATIDALPSTDVTEGGDSSADASGTRCPAGMVFIAGGEFEMGADYAADQRPAHRVRLSPFCLDSTEVTVIAYGSCDAPECTRPGTVGGCNWGVPDRGNHPMNCVSWNQASAYCVWRGATLPTEAQWEFVARAGDRRRWVWGDRFDPEGLCWSGVSTRASTCSVGSFPAERVGASMFDLMGNVNEWTADWFGAYPVDAGVTVDPVGPASGSARVHRGGGWQDSVPDSCGSTTRSADSPSITFGIQIGFRCAAAPR